MMKRYASFVFLLVFALDLLSMTSPTNAQSTDAPGFRGIWYQITSNSGDYPNKYGGGMPTYPQQHSPIAIYSPDANKTFFTFGGRDPDNGKLQHVISYYDHATGRVARPKVWLEGEKTNTGNAHDNPVLAMDDQGHLYQFSNVHGNSRRSYIRRSTQPFSIEQRVGLLSVHDPADVAIFGGSHGEVRFSYGNPWFLPRHDRFLFTHTRYDGQNRQVRFTTSADADTWAPARDLANMERGQYMVTWRKPDGKTVGAILNMHPRGGPTGSGNDARTNLYYLETDDVGQTWRAADGTEVSVPLTDADNAALVRDYQSQGLNVYIKDVNYTSAGNPVVMYLTSGGPEPGPDNNPRTVRIAHFDGTRWRDHAVTQTDHNYDHGSLYIESDDRWRIVAPFLDGPQAWGTGGEIGVWQTADQGKTWELTDQLTRDSNKNHSYVRRPLHAHDDFYAIWASGHAFSKSAVELYFSDKAGNVYRLPYDMEAEFADPILVRPIP